MLLIATIASLIIAGVVPVLTKSKKLMEIASVSAGAVALASSLIIAHRVGTSGVYSPSFLMSVDSFAAIVLLLISVTAFAASIYSIPYFREEVSKKIVGISRVRQYYALANIFIASMFVTITASHPVIAWIFLEGTTLSTVFLISFYNKRSTIEAAWKYLIISAVGLLLAFFGTLLYFTAVEATSGLITWHALLSNVSHLDPAIAKLAFVFVLIGYGTKIGLAPMHTWKPDAYSKSPAPLGALFSSALMPVAFVIMLRFKSVTDAAVGSDFSQHLLIIFGVLSVLIAAFSMLTVRNYKRLLAYSSIEHAGFMALAFGLGGIGVFAAIIHMVYHSLIKSSLFFSTGNLLLKYHSARINKVRGVASILPVTSILLLVGLFAITGFPPFGIFLTELSTISAGMGSYLPVMIIVMVGMAIAFVGFFRQFSAMVFSAAPDKSEVRPGEKSAWLLIPPAALLALALIATFYMPPFIETLIHEAARY